MSLLPFGKLNRLNRVLHRQGKHACTSCFEVYDWTPTYFRWRNRERGRLKSECRTCASATERLHYDSVAYKRQRLDRAAQVSP